MSAPTSLQRSFFTASPRVLITAPAVSRNYQLTWFQLAGEKSTPTGEPSDYWQVRLSPDDRFAALTQTTPLLRTLDVAIVPMSETGFTEQLSRAVAADGDPVWSPDGPGDCLSLASGRPAAALHARGPRPGRGGRDRPDVIDRRNAHGLAGRSHHRSHSWSEGRSRSVAVDERTGAREVIANTSFNETDGRLSPDGRWLAYVSDESGQPDVYAAPWPRGPRVRVSFAGGTRPRWTRDGRACALPTRRPQLMRADCPAPPSPRHARSSTFLASATSMSRIVATPNRLAPAPDPLHQRVTAIGRLVDWRLRW